MINEGARILEEGHALRAADIDVIYCTGYGFPRIAAARCGMPIRWASRRSTLACAIFTSDMATVGAGAAAEAAGAKKADIRRLGLRQGDDSHATRQRDVRFGPAMSP